MTDLVLCHCWDVTPSEIEELIANGVPDIEWIKRHTGLSTGSCQGRWCLGQTLAWLQVHHPEFVWDKLPTSRQPLYPVPIKALAGATPEDDVAKP